MIPLKRVIRTNGPLAAVHAAALWVILDFHMGSHALLSFLAMAFGAVSFLVARKDRVLGIVAAGILALSWVAFGALPPSSVPLSMWAFAIAIATFLSALAGACSAAASASESRSAFLAYVVASVAFGLVAVMPTLRLVEASTESAFRVGRATGMFNVRAEALRNKGPDATDRDRFEAGTAIYSGHERDVFFDPSIVDRYAVDFPTFQARATGQRDCMDRPNKEACVAGVLEATEGLLGPAPSSADLFIRLLKLTRYGPTMAPI